MNPEFRITDSHAHLDFPDFANDFDGVLSRAEAAGVKRIVTIGTSIEGSRQAIALAERYSQIYAVIGVHPTSAGEAPADVAGPLRELARHPKVVAIGEIGLDYHWLPGAIAKREKKNASDVDWANLETQDAADRARQADVFEQQLNLAAELGLNVVIHQRASWDDTLAILRRHTGRLRAVYHCFGEPPERAKELLALGHLVSFTGIITFKNAQAVQASATSIPADAFMIETDCPYLAPVPFRGQRCEPSYVRRVAETIAELRGTTIEEIGERTEATAAAFFRFERSRHAIV